MFVFLFRFGDEIKQSSLIASLSAIIQKYSIFFSESDPSRIKMIIRNNSKTLFLFREKLIFACMTKVMDDSQFYLQNLLENLNIQVSEINLIDRFKYIRLFH